MKFSISNSPAGGQFSIRKIFLAVLIVLILLFFLYKIDLLDHIQNTFLRFISPLSREIQGINKSVFSFLESMARYREINEKINRLESERNRLLLQVSRIDELEKENKALRNAMSLSKERGFNLVYAEIIAMDPVDFRHRFLVNKGKSDGISEGMPVITENSVLVGRVTGALADFSSVTTILHPESRVAVILYDIGVGGIIQGLGASEMLLDKIPKTDSIEPGQLVITSGLDSIFSKGLIVGKIQEIESDDIEFFQKAYVDPLFSFSDLNKVFIIKGLN